MASTNRRSTRDLIDEISRDGPRFRFFQAVRLLALSANKNGTAASIPDSLRFVTPLSLSFPASEIVDVRPDHVSPSQEDSSRSEYSASRSDALALKLTVGFMGLTGPSGVLPTAYTELLIERRNACRDTAAHEFLDLFSHRAVSLFYEAWRKHRFYLGYESGERDGFTRNILDLVGLGMTPLQSKLQNKNGGISDVFLAHFAGLLSRKPVSSSSLTALLQGYFKAGVEIEQFVGQWIMVPEAKQTKLGQQACRLGESAFVGERVWDRQTKIHIKVGPVGIKEFSDFLPGSPGAAAMTELVQFCVGQTLACDVSLVLKKEDVPVARLSGAPVDSLRLGYNTWLHERPVGSHPADARFALLK